MTPQLGSRARSLQGNDFGSAVIRSELPELAPCSRMLETRTLDFETSSHARPHFEKRHWERVAFNRQKAFQLKEANFKLEPLETQTRPSSSSPVEIHDRRRGRHGRQLVKTEFAGELHFLVILHTLFTTFFAQSKYPSAARGVHLCCSEG